MTDLKPETLLITLTGNDRPGVTSSIFATLSRAGDWPIAARTRDDTEPPLIAMSARSCSSSTSMIFVMKRAATEAPRACLSGCTSTRRSLVT